MTPINVTAKMSVVMTMMTVSAKYTKMTDTMTIVTNMTVTSRKLLSYRVKTLMLASVTSTQLIYTHGLLLNAALFLPMTVAKICIFSPQ